MSRPKLQLSSLDSVSDIDTDRYLALHGAAAYNRSEEYPAYTTRAFYREIAREEIQIERHASKSTLVGGLDCRVGLGFSQPSSAAIKGMAAKVVESFFRHADLDEATQALVRGRLEGRSAAEMAREIGITKQVACRKLWAVQAHLLDFLLTGEYSGLDTLYLQSVNRVLAPRKIARQESRSRYFVCPCGSHQHDRTEKHTKHGLSVTYTCANRACRVERTGREFVKLSQRVRAQVDRAPLAA